MWKKKGTCLLAFLLMLTFSISSATAVKTVYLYDPEVASEVDLTQYLSTGRVQFINGTGHNHAVGKGPAPAPYPSIMVAEQGIEQLGASYAAIDGVIFVNNGTYLVANKRALVLWMIRVPLANGRMAGEFADDLTLSLWVDWNQDNVWKENEVMVREDVNFGSHFPTADDELLFYYLTMFQIPDVTMIPSANAKFGASDKDIRYYWARAVLAYDDVDVSADGAQLFGEYEDYRLGYMVNEPVIIPTTR